MPDEAPDVDLATVQQAAKRIAGHAVRTPLLRHHRLDDATGGEIFLKPEPLQRTGSFKFRGALNAISQLSDSEKKAGVVAYSSGNHAQGVAAAAYLNDVSAIIAMPADAPDIKRRATAGWGAEIVDFDRSDPTARERLAGDIIAKTGGTLIRPFDDARIIAGQGTVGLEIAEDLERQNSPPDCILIPCGGGGLTAGTAIAVKAMYPDAEIYTVEPEGYDDTAQSLSAKSIISVPVDRPSLCDALLAPAPGHLTFAVNRNLVTAGLVVSEKEVCTAVQFAFAHFKLVIEPGGAVALAAVLHGKLDLAGRRAAVVASGGNVDPKVFADILKM